MRVLILSANTGGGHNSTARSLAQQFQRLDIECDIADTLAFPLTCTSAVPSMRSVT